MYVYRSIVVFTFILVGTLTYGQGLASSKKLLYESCPLRASDKDLEEDYRRLYVSAELALLQEIDSVYEPIKNADHRLKSRLDSASYYFCVGIYNSRLSDFEQAQKSFMQAEFLYELLGDTLALIYTQVQLANLDYYLKQEEKAYKVFLDLANHPNCDDYLKAKLHHNIGSLALEVEHESWASTDTTLKNPMDRFIQSHFDKAITYHRKSGNIFGLAATYSVYVNQLLNIGDLEGAKSLADSSAYLSEEMGDFGRLAFARIKQGMVMDKLGRQIEAIQLFDEAISYYDSTGNISQTIHALSGKRGSQINAGMIEEALSTTDQMYRNRIEFFDSQLADAHKRYEVEYKTKKKQFIINEQEISLEKKELEIANRNSLLVTTVFGALALGAFLLLLLQQNKRKAQEEKSAILIRSKQEGIKAMIQAQEEERQRIAKDLHDGIVQQLGGLKLGLQKKLNATDDSESARLIALLDDSAQELRELSHRMMPRSLKELGLVPALEDMLENSLAMADLEYEFEHYGISERMTESIEITLYRIAQELVNNVIKHSHATRVSIQLFKTGSDIVLVVEDNGRGFKESNKKGIGLLNISSRLDTVNGMVNFEPSPESGTLATIRIPIRT